MRVRKSVPEGYKTGTYSNFHLFSNPTPLTSSNTDNTTSTTPSTQKPKTRPRAGNRELTPFCGILKVGGLTQQPWEIYNSSASSTNAMNDDEEEETPFLSSQGSTVSDISIDTPNGGQKRRFFEDEEEVVENGTNGALGERVLAVPRRKKWTGKIPDSVAIVGQENLGFSFSSTMGKDVDFEEADFLDYSLGHDDLEMSG
jgi:hypothetical protein